VRPVEHGGDARVETFERAEQRADVTILRRHMRCDPAEDVTHIRWQRAVRHRATEERLPHVPMTVDKTRYDNASSGVNDIGIANAGIGRDGHDHSVLDDDVATAEVAELLVHRQDPAADNDCAITHEFVLSLC
jgi:hypothetical protein